MNYEIAQILKKHMKISNIDFTNNTVELVLDVNRFRDDLLQKILIQFNQKDIFVLKGDHCGI